MKLLSIADFSSGIKGLQLFIAVLFVFFSGIVKAENYIL